MVDEERKEGEETTKVETEETTKDTNVEAETYSAVQVEEIKQAALKEQFNELNSRLSRQGAELKRLREEKPPQTNTRQAESDIEILEAIESGGDYPALIRKKKEDLKRLENQATRETIISQQKSRLTQMIEEAELDASDERFDTAWDAFKIATQTGDFKDAESRIQRVISKAKPAEKLKDDGSKETIDPNNLTPEQEEGIARRYMEKTGKLTQDTSRSSASGKRSFTWSEIGEMSYAEWKANEVAIDEAKREGRVT